jgi:aminoglycoside phosphotransferase family enzyme/predicted kinase
MNAAAGMGTAPLRLPTEDPLVAALRDPACYPHPAGPVELVETHISRVFLAGDYAYKIKKPVDLGFLDFRSLEARRFYCEEELRLNRRTAADLYRDVVPIVETPEGVRVGGSGRAIEYALRMRRFPQEALADDKARRGELRAGDIDRIAAAIAAFHATVSRAPAESGYGLPGHLTAPALANFDQLTGLIADPTERACLEELRAWTLGEGARLHNAFEARKREGFVRECHGDLHLGNIAFLGGQPVPFDCIEFDPELRWIDVMNEIAFLAMDLFEHRLDPLAWRALNAYLESTGDYAGVGVLRYYLVYRAMVRAKIACIRALQPGDGRGTQGRALRESREYLALAASLARAGPRALILMHGLSGSGKTTIAQTMLERIGAIRVRSDIERKRLHQLPSDARTHAAPHAGIYSPSATRVTYDRLEQAARDIVSSGYPAIVDAAFLRRAERDAFRTLAAELQASFVIVSCRAPEADLRRRVARREAEMSDASEAGIAVLENQLATQEPLGGDEARHTVIIESEWNEARMREAIAEIADRFGRDSTAAS